MDKVGIHSRKGRETMKRLSEPEPDYEEEVLKRHKNAQAVTVLGDEDASVKLLEDLVFGAEDDLVERLVEDREDGGATFLDDEDSSESDVENEARLKVQPTRTAVWEDEDDDLEEEVDMTHRFRRDLTKSVTEAKMSKQKLQQRMKEQFQKAMGGKPSWAETKVKKKNKNKKKDDSDDEDSDEDGDDLMRKTGNFVGSSDSLPKGIIRMKKCLHANNDRPSEDRLTTVQFHPSAQVVMTAGLDQSISLFQVDGKTNPKIQSIHLEKFPVHKAQFSVDGEQVVATSFRNKLFYIYDMMEGKVIPVHTVRGLREQRVKEFEVSPDGESLLLTGASGYLHVLTMKTKEVVKSMKINGNITGVAFSHDGSKVFTNSDDFGGPQPGPFLESGVGASMQSLPLRPPPPSHAFIQHSLSLNDTFLRGLPRPIPLPGNGQNPSRVDQRPLLCPLSRPDASSFATSLRELEKCGWYWGPMNWEDAEMKLKAKPDGSFLVRDSSDPRYILSLSFRSQGVTHHTRMEHYRGTFSLWCHPKFEDRCHSVVEFIERAIMHSKNGKFLYFLRSRVPGLPPTPVQLLYPVSRFSSVKSLQHLCRFCIRQLVRIDHIQELPLPTPLIVYLRKFYYYDPEEEITWKIIGSSFYTCGQLT
ncbi:hypothetical protein J4Q44_G00383890 [Coregonus suidteri]|uniref:Suppressor of cytokine signaling 7 n=1 Tax=Coregonus suidteri TaxID=861788 RepID=A0AAN8KF18_9TELE